MSKRNDRATVISFTQGVLDRIRREMGEPKKGLRSNTKKPVIHPQVNPKEKSGES